MTRVPADEQRLREIDYRLRQTGGLPVTKRPSNDADERFLYGLVQKLGDLLRVREQEAGATLERKLEDSREYAEMIQRVNRAEDTANRAVREAERLRDALRKIETVPVSEKGSDAGLVSYMRRTARAALEATDE